MAKIELIKGVEGLCLAINNNLIAGPKPWGGGKVVDFWIVPDEYILDAIEASQPAVEAKAKGWCKKCNSPIVETMCCCDCKIYEKRTA